MTPMEQMIAMTKGPQRGRALVEDSPLEAPVSGFNRHASLMSPATREMVLKSRTQDIEKFAESRQLNANAVLGIAEAAMRLGRVPDLRQYGFSGDDAKAIKQFIAGDVLNIAIEHIEGMETINEALTDRIVAESVKQLVQSGAGEILRKVKEDKDKPGYIKALHALKAGDLNAVKGLMGEGATIRGASQAVIDAMEHADAKVKEHVKTEATVSNNLGALMSLSQNQAMYRPSPVLTTAVRKEPEEDRLEQERAMALGPRIGINPFAKQAVTIEDMAKLARESEEASEADKDPTSTKMAQPKGEKLPGKKGKLRSPGEYEPGQFHPGSHGTAESENVGEAVGHAHRQFMSKSASPATKARAGAKLHAAQQRRMQKPTKNLGGPTNWDEVHRQAAHERRRGVKTKGRTESTETEGSWISKSIKKQRSK